MLDETREGDSFDSLMTLDAEWEGVPYTTTLLHHAVANHLNNAALLLINAGANINALSKNSLNDMGNTPLHLAARQGNTSAIQFLIQRGADPSIKNNKGQIALDVALESIYKMGPEIIIRESQKLNLLENIVEAYMSAATNQREIASRLMPNPDILLRFAQFQKITKLSELMPNPELLPQIMDNINAKKTSRIK